MNEINKENIIQNGTLLIKRGVIYEVCDFVSEYHLKELNESNEYIESNMKLCVPSDYINEYHILSMAEAETNMDGIEL